MKEAGGSGFLTQVGDGVDIVQLTQRVEILEKWKETELEPWRSIVNVELETTKEDIRTTTNRLDQISMQIDELKKSRYCWISFEVMGITLVTLIIITIIFSTI